MNTSLVFILLLTLVGVSSFDLPTLKEVRKFVKKVGGISGVRQLCATASMSKKRSAPMDDMREYEEEIMEMLGGADGVMIICQKVDQLGDDVKPNKLAKHIMRLLKQMGGEGGEEEFKLPTKKQIVQLLGQVGGANGIITVCEAAQQFYAAPTANGGATRAKRGFGGNGDFSYGILRRKRSMRAEVDAFMGTPAFEDIVESLGGTEVFVHVCEHAPELSSSDNKKAAKQIRKLLKKFMKNKQ